MCDEPAWCFAVLHSRRGSGALARQPMPIWLAQGVGHDAFLHTQFQMTIAGQRI